MANIRLFKQSFAGGEVAPEMLGRIDDVKYGSGLQKCRNFIVKPQGAVENRAGFEYIRPVKYEDKKTRLLPFYYSNDQTLVIEFGAGYCRFHTLASTIMDVSTGQPYEITTPYAEEDLFDVHYVQSADVLTLVHPKYPPKELRRYGANDWRLVDIDFMPKVSAPTGVSVATTGTGQYSYFYVVTAMDGDNISESEQSIEVQAVNNLYTTGNKNRISWNMVQGASRYRVYKRQNGLFGYIGQTTDTFFDDDLIDPSMDVTPPLYDEIFKTGGITGVTISNGGSGYISEGSVIRVDILNYGSNIDLDDGVYDINKEIDKQFYTIKFSFGGKTGTGANINIKITNKKISSVLVLDGGSGYSNARLSIFKKSKIAGTIIADNGARFNVILSNEPTLVLSDATGHGAILNPIIVNGIVTGINILAKGTGYTNPTVTMVSNAGSGFVAGAITVNGQDYPGAVSYFQQRRVFAGTIAKPQSIWMTKSGTESNMSFSIPIKDDDRIAVRVAAREASRILHIVSLTNLMLLTNSAEWKVGTNNSDVLTPSTISVMPYSYVGASDVQPIVVNNTMIYAASRGGHVRELAYSWQAGGYVTGDISLRAPHLFDDNQIIDIAQVKAPIPILWMVSSSGLLLGCTYIPEQEVCGWHRHDTKNGIFLSCAAVAEGSTDVLYVITQRVINGQRRQFIERMRNRSFTTPSQAFFVDCALSYSGSAVTTVTGLDHLEGEKVSILADGSVHPKKTVKNGEIHLDYPASIIHVGLPIESDLETVPVAAQIDSGYAQGRMKNVNKVWLRVHASSGIWVGSDANNLVESKQRSNEPAGSPPSLKEREIDVTPRGSWTDSGKVYVRQYDPLPITVVSMTAEVAIGA